MLVQHDRKKAAEETKPIPARSKHASIRLKPLGEHTTALSKEEKRKRRATRPNPRPSQTLTASHIYDTLLKTKLTMIASDESLAHKNPHTAHPSVTSSPRPT
ncbi:hypothetical protein Dimus_032541 [Dionaea muscipula]